ncbi:hypothetical protein M5E06_14945 [Azospirillum sp. A1-3]|uniref:hypothetical protein n=1 Tax=Azospirillum sp. A1-3 TaxID=185874 RepID=UPI0020771778|nr:hypothetical protein [Azospirillum sp. A1-3]MCM8735456.1 hypothetical protein [Azospirillum sp. A1-3]
MMRRRIPDFRKPHFAVLTQVNRRAVVAEHSCNQLDSLCLSALDADLPSRTAYSQSSFAGASPLTDAYQHHSETMMSEIETVTAEVIAVRKAPFGGKLLALIDVAIAIHGIEFKVRGLRVSKEIMNGNYATSVSAPFHRDIDGQWSPTVTFPVELQQPLSDIVLATCIEAGVCCEA